APGVEQWHRAELVGDRKLEHPVDLVDRGCPAVGADPILGCDHAGLLALQALGLRDFEPCVDARAVVILAGPLVDLASLVVQPEGVVHHAIHQRLRPADPEADARALLSLVVELVPVPGVGLLGLHADAMTAANVLATRWLRNP